MSGGPVEAALISAAVGAGTSAIQGKDPLTGALIGGIGGALAPGLGEALGGSAANTGATLVGQQGAQSAASAAINEAAKSQIANNVATNAGLSNAVSQAGVMGSGSGVLPTGFAGIQGLPGAMSGTQVASTGLQTVSQGGTPAVNSIFDVLSKPKTGDLANMGIKERFGNYLVQNPVQGGLMLGGGANLLFNQPRPEIPGNSPEFERARRALGFYKFDPRIYRPAYANGGITDLDVGNTSRMPGNPVIMMRSGGISDLGSYSDGGRLLKGPGDGVSDSIPAQIGRRQPARLADGEFVVPARIVSELGNGSTDAGARQLYAMMDRVQSRRGKTTGKNRVAVDSKARKLLPA